MRTRSVLAPALALMLFSLAAPSLGRAQTTDTGPSLDAPMGRPGLLRHVLGPLFPILRRLQLTPDQRDQIKGILQGHREEIRGLVQREVEARRPLFEAVYIDPFDESVIRDRSAAVAAVEADAAVLRATIRTQIFAVLTPDQQARAIEALRRFEQHRHMEDESQP